MGISVDQKRIAIFSGKGGVGKSTLSAILAVAAQDSILIDCDPQASVSHWGDVRGGEPEVLSIPPTRLKKTLTKLNHQYVLVDTPGALVSGTLDALKQMDLILIVSPTDTFELAALNDTLNTAEVAQVPIALLVNRLHPQAKAETALEILSELELPICPIVIRERALHKHALIEGKTCLDQDSMGIASIEINAVWQWIKDLLHSNSESNSELSLESI